MKVLVTFASRHGSTREIAEMLAQELRVCGQSVAVRPVDDVVGIERYEAVVIGSAVYLGNWLPEARHFVERNRDMLATVPVWLFSSGPLGREDPQPKGDPGHLDALMEAARARGHRTFVGKLDQERLRLTERLMAKVAKAPEGDFRDWEDVRDWAREIASALPTTTATAHDARITPIPARDE